MRGSESRAFGLSRNSWKWNWSVLSLFLLGASFNTARPAAEQSLYPAHNDRESLVSGSLAWPSGEVPSWSRNLKQLAPSPSDTIVVSNASFILAKDRTARRDPLNDFKKYREGWDIRSEHYWASVGLTGIPGFILAAVWVALGAALLLLLLCCCCCCRKRVRGPHEGGIALPLLLLLLFTAAAVAGSVLLYIGQGKLHDELSGTLHFVVDQSRTVVVELRNVTTVLKNTETIDVANFALSNNDKTQIQQLSQQLNNAADELESKTNDNAHKIRTGLDDVRLAMIIVAGVMLLFVLLGLLFATLGVGPLVYFLVFIGWFLVAGTWILCGVYILLNNAMGDTCIAMEEWVNNPTAKTNLDDILPCVDVNTANKTLDQTRKLTNETVNGINGVLRTVTNRNPARGVPLLCNPVETRLSPTGCTQLSNASIAWEPYICRNSSSAARCALQGQFPLNLYNQLNASVKAINDLYVSVPFLIDLEDCQFVRQTFTQITETHCHGLRKYSKWEYIGLALVSGGVMFSILFWIIFSRRRKKHGRMPNGEPKYGQPIYGGGVQSESKPV